MLVVRVGLEAEEGRLLRVAVGEVKVLCAGRRDLAAAAARALKGAGEEVQLAPLMLPRWECRRQGRGGGQQQEDGEGLFESTLELPRCTWAAVF